MLVAAHEGKQMSVSAERAEVLRVQPGVETCTYPAHAHPTILGQVLNDPRSKPLAREHIAIGGLHARKLDGGRYYDAAMQRQAGFHRFHPFATLDGMLSP